jgi:hypothetical protein
MFVCGFLRNQKRDGHLEEAQDVETTRGFFTLKSAKFEGLLRDVTKIRIAFVVRQLRVLYQVRGFRRFRRPC